MATCTEQRRRREAFVDPVLEARELRFMLSQLASRAAQVLPQDDPALCAAFEMLAPHEASPADSDDDLKSRLQWPIARLRISVRIINTLEDEGIFTIEQLLMLKRDRLARIANLGPKCIDSILDALAEIGFSNPLPKAS